MIDSIVPNTITNKKKISDAKIALPKLYLNPSNMHSIFIFLFFFSLREQVYIPIVTGPVIKTDIKIPIAGID